MSDTMTLTGTEIDILGDADRPIAETTDAYTQLPAAAVDDTAAVFEKALRIKMTLDAFEEKAKVKPSKTALAVLINGEYQLHRLYTGTPIRHNPFLSHWVETVQRLDALSLGKTTTLASIKDISIDHIIAARALWIKTLLLEDGTEAYTKVSPADLGRVLEDKGLSKVFELQPYIHMLQEEGIYEAGTELNNTTSSVSAAAEMDDYDRHQRGRNGDGRVSLYKTIRQWKDSIPQKLKEDRERAIFEITRLPVELSSLDYLTTLLTNRTLEAHSIEPGPVVTQYIQHALRTIERMEQPPGGSQDGMEDPATDFPVQLEKDIEYGKEAQSRAVRLLLLFIKSLIRKRLISADVLYFEIQEICVRYVWIREAREFRTWVEEGSGEDCAS